MKLKETRKKFQSRWGEGGRISKKTLMNFLLSSAYALELYVDKKRERIQDYEKFMSATLVYARIRKLWARLSRTCCCHTSHSGSRWHSSDMWAYNAIKRETWQAKLQAITYE